MNYQTKVSEIHSNLDGRRINQLKGLKVTADTIQELQRLGIYFPNKQLKTAMDSLQPTVTTASIGTPIQFLQEWLPGFVEVITNARRIDILIGLSTVGDWADEEVVQGVRELVGSAVPYQDNTNLPLSSWNTNFVYRTVVRFEEGMRITNLEEERSARMRVNDSQSKRQAAALALEINRNAVGFYGYNNGNNNTYGFLTDPGLPNYVTVPVGASGSTHWSTKTLLEIDADIRNMISTLRTQSGDQIDPAVTPCTLAVATDVVDFLSTTSDFGYSVKKWLSDNYPKIRVESAPELNSANGGQNVGYLYADKINDDSTDGGQTWLQPVPAKFMLQGVEKQVKGYQEGYLNATAGAMCKRPYAVTRVTGI
jgi:hypothetical protein